MLARKAWTLGRILAVIGLDAGALSLDAGARSMRALAERWGGAEIDLPPTIPVPAPYVAHTDQAA
jgi:hypothetical protein